MIDMTEVAKEAYTSYGEVIGRQALMDTWDELADPLQAAWTAAASTVWFLAKEDEQ